MIKSLSETFSSGASYLISEDLYIRYIRDIEGDLIGRPDGQFVAPSIEMDRVMAESGGNPRIMEEMLGLDAGSLGDNPIRVDIANPQDYNLRTPDSSLSGANENFIPGGQTSGGVSEGVIDPFPNP